MPSAEARGQLWPVQILLGRDVGCGLLSGAPYISLRCISTTMERGNVVSGLRTTFLPTAFGPNVSKNSGRLVSGLQRGTPAPFVQPALITDLSSGLVLNSASVSSRMTVGRHASIMR